MLLIVGFQEDGFIHHSRGLVDKLQQNIALICLRMFLNIYFIFNLHSP